MSDAHDRAREIVQEAMLWLNDWWGGANLSDDALYEVLGSAKHELRRAINAMDKAQRILEEANDDSQDG